jgi:hypothetical protein
MPRALSRLLAGSAVGLVALSTLATPAQATAGDAAVVPYTSDLAVAADGSPKTGLVIAAVEAPAGDPVHIRKVQVTLDLAGVQDLFTVTVDDGEMFKGLDCSTVGTKVTCSRPIDEPVDEPVLIPFAELEVAARKGATPGTSGKLVLEARADDGPVGRYESTVTVGEGVDLVAFGPKPPTVTPDTVGSTEFRVSNAGTVPVTGSVLVLDGLADLDGAQGDGDRFSNCTYGWSAICTFDDTLAPGRAYRTSAAWPLTVPKDASAGSFVPASGYWFTTAEWQEILDLFTHLGDEEGGDLDIGKPGTGPALTLTATSAAARTPQVDLNPDDNHFELTVTVGGDDRFDLAAVGASITGAVGDRVEVEIGAVNNGPATLYTDLFVNNDTSTLIDVPAGLKAVAVDDDCFASDSEDFTGEPGAPQYVCESADDTLAAGARRVYDFTFEVRAGATERSGQVVVNDWDWNGSPLFDGDKSNDRSAITVSVTGEGGGGTLPITGANVGLIAGGGALLIAAGVVGMLAVRRRRVHFTA